MILYSVAEVAKMLRVSTRTVYRLIERQKIGVYQIGGRRKITREQIDQYLESSRSPAAEDADGGGTCCI